jgi:hypothetical protein
VPEVHQLIILSSNGGIKMDKIERKIRIKQLIENRDRITRELDEARIEGDISRYWYSMQIKNYDKYTVELYKLIDEI